MTIRTDAPKTGLLDAPLSGVRIIDLSRVVAGPFGTQALADLGAEVLRVLPPNAAPPPVAEFDRSEAFDWALNRDKSLVYLNLHNEDDYSEFLTLVKGADVVYDNFRPGVTTRLAIDRDHLAAVNPRIITCSISGFGGDGPWRDLPAYDVVVQAASGAMKTTADAATGEPVRLGFPIGDIAGGMYAAIGVVAALLQRDRTGVGQQVDVSLLDCQIALGTYRIPQCLDSHIDIRADQHRGGAGSTPYGPFQCSDRRWITLGVAQQHWEAAASVLGIDELVHDVRFDTEPHRILHQTELDSIVAERISTAPAAQWEARLRAYAIPCGVVHTIAEAARQPMVAERSMLLELVDGFGRRAHVANSPMGWRHSSKPPCPPIAATSVDWQPVDDLAYTKVENATATQPLTGIRVLELEGEEPSKAIASQILADLGAEVVLVERPTGTRAQSPSHADVTPAVALREGLHRGKQSITLDLKDDAGRKTFNRLLSTASIVIDNYRPGVLDRLGMPLEAILAEHPELTWLSITAFGHTSSIDMAAAYDVNIQALAGTMSITGSAPEGMPMRWGYPIGGLAGALYGALSTLANIKAGTGRRIDLSLFDCQLAMQAYRIPQAIDLGIQFAPEPHAGGSGARPYGPYQTSDGTWATLAITEQFWHTFCAAAGAPNLENDPRFATEHLREQNAIDLHEIITRLVQTKTSNQWQDIFVKNRIPASVVYHIKQLPSLGVVQHSGMIKQVKRRDGRIVHLAGFPVRMSGNPTGCYTQAPERGEHNDTFAPQLGWHDRL